MKKLPIGKKTSTTTAYSCFVVCPGGIETVLLNEMKMLGLNPGKAEDGGVPFTGDLTALYKANLYLRTATRVIVRLGSFPAAAFVELIRKVSKLDWGKFIPEGKAVSIRATCKRSRLYHSGAVAERVAIGMSAFFKRKIVAVKYDEDQDGDVPVLVIVRLADNLCTISMDSSGAMLSNRGYRKAVAKAPIRESLAAAMIMATGWNGEVPLIDPFCGSGTIPIEAALIAKRTAPGLHRRFAFMDWPEFNEQLWKKMFTDANAIILDKSISIQGTDRDQGAIEAAVANAERVRLEKTVAFNLKTVSDIVSPGSEPGWIITNPPYGIRLSGQDDLRDLFAGFGKVMRMKFPGWHIAMLVSDPNLLRHTGLKFDKKPLLSFLNGGIRVTLWGGRTG